MNVEATATLSDQSTLTLTQSGTAISGTWVTVTTQLDVTPQRVFTFSAPLVGTVRTTAPMVQVTAVFSSPNGTVLNYVLAVDPTGNLNTLVGTWDRPPVYSGPVTATRQ